MQDNLLSRHEVHLMPKAARIAQIWTIYLNVYFLKLVEQIEKDSKRKTLTVSHNLRINNFLYSLIKMGRFWKRQAAKLSSFWGR